MFGPYRVYSFFPYPFLRHHPEFQLLCITSLVLERCFACILQIKCLTLTLFTSYLESKKDIEVAYAFMFFPASVRVRIRNGMI